MARMKFMCDTKRCIECNGCVTACKNENDDALEWGIQRRRVVTLNDGLPGRPPSRSPACTAPTPLHGGLPVLTASITPTTASCCTTRISASVAATACLPARSGRPSSRRPPPLAIGARWTSAPSVPVARKRITARRSARSTVPTASPRASCPCVPSSAPPRRCWRGRAGHLRHLP